MYKPSEGMRRLGITAGVLSSVAWVVFVAVVSNGFAKTQTLVGIIYFVGVPVCFALGFIVIWSIDWIGSGFREGTRS
jgi:hypothetical protein